VIDLHLHSSASDGLLAPADLVRRIAAAGVSICSLTDHDTVAGLAEASAEAAACGLGFVSGIEITAMADGRDVHMLGYGFDPDSAPFEAFLCAQREERRLRIRRLLDRLAELGMPLDEARVVAAPGEAPGAKGRAVGRPHVARAMVDAGYVASVAEAFDAWLGTGRPAFVSRAGASPAEVVAIVQSAGGVAALAHPGVTKRDDVLPALVAAGIDAIEVWHSEHDAEQTQRYAEIASAHELLMTGGSDFHGDQAGRVCGLGTVGMPREAFEALMVRLGERARVNASARAVETSVRA
jgi:3',5'-nucleoside bisphosphate phosphatase